MVKAFTAKELEELIVSGNVRKEETFMNGRVKVVMIFPSEKERMELRSKILREKGEDIEDWELACEINEELNIVTFDGNVVSFTGMSSTISNMIHNIRDAYSRSVYEEFLKDENQNPKQ